MRIISGKSNFFSALWGRITLPFQQPKFEKTINLLKPALQGSNFSKMLDAVKTIDMTVKQNLKLANQKTLDVFKPMLQDGSEGAIRIIGILVEHNPELATQETLDLLKPILDGTLPLGLTVMLHAIRTADIIFKKNPDLATEKNLALFNAVIEDGNSQEMGETKITIATILKQNPALGPIVTSDDTIIKSWSDQVKGTDAATAYIERVILAGQNRLYSDDLDTVEQ